LACTVLTLSFLTPPKTAESSTFSRTKGHFGVNVALCQRNETRRSEAVAIRGGVRVVCDGFMAYEPMSDHQLEYWRESLRRPQNVLFLRYEEMKERPEENVRRLAEFMVQPFTMAEEVNGTVGGW